MRFDLLLFELRLFKSRSQASQAIQQGAALLNRERAKPSRPVRTGDLLTVVTGERRRTYQVIELPHASLSKQEARTLVREVEGG
jgi:ribosome-associated heat shock protein Hsp15